MGLWSHHVSRILGNHCLLSCANEAILGTGEVLWERDTGYPMEYGLPPVKTVFHSTVKTVFDLKVKMVFDFNGQDDF